MRRRRRLGQHLLSDEKVLGEMVEAAKISKEDVVLEIGSGDGRLTEGLCKGARKVVSYEIDEALHRAAKARLSGLKNLTLIHGDGFRSRLKFDVLVSSLPYSQSSRFVEWLIGKGFKRAVVMVQREFAEKLLSRPKEGSYRAVSALAQARFKIEALERVGKEAFKPRPRVSSTILSIEPRGEGRIGRELVRWVKGLFSFRGRTLSSALKAIARRRGLDPEALKGVGEGMLHKRIEELEAEEAIAVAGKLERLEG